jgi:hypothetical protein
MAGCLAGGLADLVWIKGDDVGWPRVPEDTFTKHTAKPVKMVKNGPKEAVLTSFGTHPVGVGFQTTPTGCGFKRFFVKSHNLVILRKNPCFSGHF